MKDSEFISEIYRVWLPARRYFLNSYYSKKMRYFNSVKEKHMKKPEKTGVSGSNKHFVIRYKVYSQSVKATPKPILLTL